MDSNQTVVPQSVSTHTTWPVVEQRGLTFFKDMIASRLVNGDDLDFWNSVVLCGAELHIAIRQLVTALASMHEKISIMDADPDRSKRLEATVLGYCNKAIQSIRNPQRALPGSVLAMSCILIVGLELLRGDYVAARSCVDSGLAMSGRSKGEIIELRWGHFLPNASIDHDMRTINFTNAKMAAASEMFAWGSDTYLEDGNGLSVSLDFVRGPFTNFRDVMASAEKLLSISSRLLRNLSNTAYIDPESRFAQALTQHFLDFGSWFEEYYVREELLLSLPQPNEMMQHVWLKFQEALIIHHCMLLSNDELMFDQWNHVFEEVVQVVAKYLDSSSTSLDPTDFVFVPFSAPFVPSLWLTASRCREPGLRRKAISLLCNHRRREASHDGATAGKLAQEIMLIEERGLPSVEVSVDLPRDKRIRLTGASYVAEQRRVRLEYIHAPYNQTMCPVREEWLDWSIHSTQGLSIDEVTTLDSHLHALRAFTKVDSVQAMSGFVKPMFYEGHMIPILHST